VIHWLIQTTAAHPGLANGQPPGGLLSADETAVFDRFKVPKRRQDWLLGRWTAKHLLREIIRLENVPMRTLASAPTRTMAAGEMRTLSAGTTMPLAAITILPGKDGAPRVSFAAPFDHHNSSFTVSISHSHRTSLCAAVTQPDYALGADIERIESRPARFAADFFTMEEQAQVERAADGIRDVVVTAVWSAKEAALKATRQGLRMDTRSLNCQFAALTEPPVAWQPFHIQWKRQLDEGQLPNLIGWWMIVDDFVLTLVAEDDPGAFVF